MARLGDMDSNADIPMGVSGGAVTIADGDAATLGARADAAATTDSGTFSLVAFVKRLLAKLPALANGRWPVDGSGVTQPVSGTFWQATQAVRQVKDTGRTPVTLEINNIAAVASEALISYGGHRGGVALTPGTGAYVVTAGKTLHIQNVVIVAQGTALATLRLRLRALATTVVLASPVYLGGAVVTPANGGGTSEMAFGDGVEIPAGFQAGLSVVGATTQTYSAWITGYEY